STFPPELVDQVIERTGRAEQRRRLLPARVVVYFVLALAPYGQAAYEEVMRCLVEGLGWATQARRGRRSWPCWHLPRASALAEARTRLGAEPPGRCCSPRPPGVLATTATRGLGSGAGGCWCWTGPAWACPAARRTGGWAGPGAAAGRGGRVPAGPGGGAGGGRHARDRRRRPGPVRGRGADAGPPACPRPWPAGAGGAAAGRPAVRGLGAVAGD